MEQLIEIFHTQKEIQNKLGNDIKSQQFKNDMILALIAESTEALNETPWKPWKKRQLLNNEKFKDELVDIQIFLLNLVISSEMGPYEFINKVQSKQEENLARIRNGY